MKKATVMNDVQEIQKVLEEYLGNRKAAKVAVGISAVMQGETQHTHRGEDFFVHKDETGKLVLTMESSVKENVQAILNSYLEEDEAQECIEQLIAGNLVNPDVGFETIMVEDSGSEHYTVLMKHKPQNNQEQEFMKNLKAAINAKVASFRVPVNDPSIDMNGKLQFASGFKPAVGYSYNELEKLAKENGLRLGKKNEYCLFLGTMIIRLMAEGWSEKEAWFAVCTESRELGHYLNSVEAKGNFEVTGSRMIASKCDLANTCKVLARDEKAGGFWFTGGYYLNKGGNYPLAELELSQDYVFHYYCSVGWFVL